MGDFLRTIVGRGLRAIFTYLAANFHPEFAKDVTAVVEEIKTIARPFSAMTTEIVFRPRAEGISRLVKLALNRRVQLEQVAVHADGYTEFALVPKH